VLNGFGWPHLLIIAALVVILFGAKRLPDAARGLGRSMRIFRAEARGMQQDEAAAAAGQQQTQAPQQLLPPQQAAYQQQPVQPTPYQQVAPQSTPVQPMPAQQPVYDAPAPTVSGAEQADHARAHGEQR
jgi:sec-independent protein translocase protein TatA